eukprot:gnl/Chilomastix_cuspidata/313.p1 GENE.gnl/Chilomastix_cuspidata/313~~gnl/Chilomastix_cuspidata/313.p1  ORF type:complete len:1186 (-),score=271.65 gnl/Chilomastix_cuspidata/313:672-4229(-)
MKRQKLNGFKKSHQKKKQMSILSSPPYQPKGFDKSDLGTVYDVVVIGGGIIGTCVLRELSKYLDLKILLLEKSIELCAGTSKANSGIIHAGLHSDPKLEKGKYVVQGNDMIKELARELNFGYIQCGELIVAVTEDELETLSDLEARAKEKGVPVEFLNRAQTLEREPNLNPDLTGALLCPTAAICNPYEAVLQIGLSAARNGATIGLGRKVTNVSRHGDIFKVTAELTQESWFYPEHAAAFEGEGRPVATYGAKYIVNAAGLFADEVSQMFLSSLEKPVDLDYFIVARKGEEFLLARGDTPAVNTVIFPVPTPVSKGTLVIPTVDGPTMVGPTAVEIEGKEDLTTDASSFFDVLKKIETTSPAVARAARNVHFSSFAGLRAVTRAKKDVKRACAPESPAVDGDFVIRSLVTPSFVEVSGIQSPGLTSSPSIALRVMSLLGAAGLRLEPKRCIPLEEDMEALQSDELNPTLETFDYSKFFMHGRAEFLPGLLPPPRSRKGNPATKSTVVCRCEQVTLADVRAAIRMGARSLDGIKSRSRAGMGLCQGGFCTPTLMRILRAELHRLGYANAPVITKKGGRSALAWHDMEDLAFSKPVLPHTVQPAPSDEADVVVVGGGPAGLGVAISIKKENPALRVLVFDRGSAPGGILLQCIHSGFGLKRYRQELTGPEYGERLAKEAADVGVEIFCNTFVRGVWTKEGDSPEFLTLTTSEDNFALTKSRTLVMCSGSRERPASSIHLSSSRPAGIMTAGTAQALINLHGVLPGRRAVILGSGDVGLIMARRLTLEGVSVAGVYEILPKPSGLRRNILQCLDDYQIPLHVAHTITKVHGEERVTGVTVSQVEGFRPIPGTEQYIPCDLLLLSVGLRPDTAVGEGIAAPVPDSGAWTPIASIFSRVAHPRTKGPLVGSSLMVRPGLFVAGNVLHTHDLADMAAEEGARAGKFVATFLGGRNAASEVPVEAGPGVLYCVPNSISKETKPVNAILFRVSAEVGEASLKLTHVAPDGTQTPVVSKTIRGVVPAEMESLIVTSRHIDSIAPWSGRFELSVVETAPLPAPAKDATVLTCIKCPNGCTLHVRPLKDMEDDYAVTGNKCSRGRLYALQEMRAPSRVFSTTLPLAVSTDGVLPVRVPVKLAAEIPKARLLDMARAIRTGARHVDAKAVKTGDVLLPDVLGLSDVVAASSFGLAE